MQVTTTMAPSPGPVSVEGRPRPQTHRWFLSDRLCHLVPTTTAAAAAAQAAWSRGYRVSVTPEHTI
jgi:hypothetical protein